MTTETCAATSNQMLHVYTDAYAQWNLGPHHHTKGVRYVNATARIAELAGAHGVKIATVEPRSATREELALVHDQAYIASVLDGDSCPVSTWDEPRPDLSLLAQLMAGGTLTALEALASRSVLTAVNLPGAKHHAQRDDAAGYCVFADLAMAAELVTQGKIGRWSRVAVFDFDVHHGDGTEALLAGNDRVLTYSVHRYGGGFYPGTGAESLPEKHVYNRPLQSGDGNLELLDATRGFCELSAQFGAEIIFIAGGADGHISDPLGGRHGGGIEYTVEGIAEAMKAIRESFPTSPILFGGAGGYLPAVSDDPLAEGPYGSTAEVWATATLTLAAGARTEVPR